MAYQDALRSYTLPGYQPVQKQSGFNEFLWGTPQQEQQVPSKGGFQIQHLQDLLQNAQSRYQNPTAGFEPIAANARQQFATQTVPSIAERFTAFKNGSNRNSSGFQGALGSAASGLESDLASQGANYGLQNQQLGLQQSQLGLQDYFQTQRAEHQPGLFDRIGEGIFGQGKNGEPSNASNLINLLIKILSGRMV